MSVLRSCTVREVLESYTSDHVVMQQVLQEILKSCVPLGLGVDWMVLYSHVCPVRVNWPTGPK